MDQERKYFPFLVGVPSNPSQQLCPRESSLNEPGLMAHKGLENKFQFS